MHYISTRGYGSVSFVRTLLDGLAPDGGLYMPERYPLITPEEMEEFTFYSYEEIAERVMSPFVDGEIENEQFQTMIKRAYSVFDDIEVTPLTQYNNDLWMLELFHGPTLAFKDVALQMMGQLLDWALERADMSINVIGATSGDTGPAAIYGLHSAKHVNVFMLFPHNRVSMVQRLQMTTSTGKNIFPIAVEGTFDDCQALVKEMLADADFRSEVNATAVNSISWARLMPQIVYYFFAWSRLRELVGFKPLSFAVPTGNFGNIFAGYVAMQMGLPVNRLLCASNVNDILYRFFTDGDYSTGIVQPTRSPSIDIQVASNFERLLFDLFGRDSDKVTSYMKVFSETGKMPPLSALEMDEVRSVFSAERVNEVEMLKTISSADAEKLLTLDPHTAVAVTSAERHKHLSPCVAMATAHPAKFPRAVQEATGTHPHTPEFIKEMEEAEEKFEILPNDIEQIKKYILDNRLI